MDSIPQFLLGLGGILLLGLATDLLGKRTFLPRVTLLLVFGVLIGQEGFDIIPQLFLDRFDLIANMALLMVGFLLGGKLTKDHLQTSGKIILWISAMAAVMTTVVVTIGLSLIGLPLELAVLLGTIASATAPAATVDIILESEERGLFGQRLLNIVALDDAWGIILFSIGLSFVAGINGIVDSKLPILIAFKDIGGSILLGMFIGLPAAYLTGRIRPGQPILTEALALVFICGGLAIWLEISFLVASMVMGAVISNLAKHHERPFHAIENIEWPFMAVFFVLAGASLEFDLINEVGLVIIVYILSRTIGKIIGSETGARLGRADIPTRKWMGVALLPQAGAAMGMALVASNHFPEYRQVLLSIIISTTIFFEIIGPVFTRWALRKASS